MVDSIQLKEKATKMVEAIKTNNDNEVRKLLDEGFPIDTPIDNNGMTVLAYVCANCNHQLIIEAVITRSPNVNTRDTTGNTPLHFAARKSSRTNDPQLD